MRYANVLVSDVARDAILAIRSKAMLAKVRRRLELLAVAPEMGVPFDPAYESARLDHDVLVTYVGQYGIYYTYDNLANRVDIEFLCDERQDPSGRFEEPWGTVGDLEVT